MNWVCWLIKIRCCICFCFGLFKYIPGSAHNSWMKNLSHPKFHVLTVPNRLFHVFQLFQNVELNQIHFPENHPTTTYQNTSQSFLSLGIPLMWPIILTSFYKTAWYLLQATKFCPIEITGFRYSYFTVRVTTNDTLVPSFHRKGNDRPYRGNDQRLG